MLPRTNYMQVFAVAVRLTRGETIEFIDRHARRWCATATSLHLMKNGVWRVIIEGYAADMAEEVVRRRAPGNA
jgi:hypothetical protein